MTKKELLKKLEKFPDDYIVGIFDEIWGECHLEIVYESEGIIVFAPGDEIEGKDD